MAGVERLGWGVAMATASLLVAAGWWFHGLAEDRLEGAVAALRRVEGERREALRAARLRERYAPRFQALVDQGVIVDGRRGGAGEGGAARLAGLGDAEATAGYRFGEAEPFVPVEGALAQAVVARIALRHEGELLARLDALRGAGVGWLRVDGCELWRGDGEGGPLTAECRLRWLFVEAEEVGR